MLRTLSSLSKPLALVLLLANGNAHAESFSVFSQLCKDDQSDVECLASTCAVGEKHALKHCAENTPLSLLGLTVSVGAKFHSQGIEGGRHRWAKCAFLCRYAVDE